MRSSFAATPRDARCDTSWKPRALCRAMVSVTIVIKLKLAVFIKDSVTSLAHSCFGRIAPAAHSRIRTVDVFRGINAQLALFMQFQGPQKARPFDRVSLTAAISPSHLGNVIVTVTLVATEVIAQVLPKLL